MPRKAQKPVDSLREKLRPLTERKVTPEGLPEFLRDVLATAAPISIPEVICALTASATAGDKAAARQLAEMYRLMPQKAGGQNVLSVLVNAGADASPKAVDPSTGAFDQILRELEAPRRDQHGDIDDRAASAQVVDAEPVN